MSRLRWIIAELSFCVAVACTMAGCNTSGSTAPLADTADSSPSSTGDKVAADDPFALPQGSADELVDFIHKLATPEPFRNEAEMTAYKDKASRAISAAADRLLSKATSDEQLSDAVDWKVVAFQIMTELGDSNAAAATDKFLDRMMKDKRPAVRSTAFLKAAEASQKQDQKQKLAVLEKFVAVLKANGLTQQDLDALHDYSTYCSQALFFTSDAPAQQFRELLPLVANNKDPEISNKADKFAAAIRRLELPGQKLAIEGQLFDGAQLDWAAYRGKVVLIDFWASDCSECMSEIPNLVRLYRAYHDKGFEIVGVNLDHDRKLVTDIIATAGITWPQLFDENPNAGHWEHPLSKKFAIDVLPRMILVDKDGTVVHTNARGSLLADQLKKQLGEPAVALDDDIPKTVPDGTAAEIMAFMEDTLQKLPRPRSREEQIEYLEKIRALLGVAGEKILAGEPTMDQASEAIQMKLASLAKSMPIGPVLNQDQEQFLAKLEANAKPAVAGALAERRLMQAISKWEDITAADRAAAVDKYVPFAKSSPPSEDLFGIVSNLAMMSSETGDMSMTKRLVDALMPGYKESSNPQIARLATKLEGIGRRADLPGKPFELEGTFLDGTKLNWSSYRGKVVLVDFWASWCKPCLAEMPNILSNYQAFHDQGFEVIGVSLDEERQAAKAVTDAIGIPWPSLISADAAATNFDSPLAVQYGITAIPAAFLIDRDGKVVTMMTRGPLLQQQLKKLLSK